MTPQEYLDKLNEIINNALKELEAFRMMCKKNIEKEDTKQINNSENNSNEE